MCFVTDMEGRDNEERELLTAEPLAAATARLVELLKEFLKQRRVDEADDNRDGHRNADREKREDPGADV